MNFILLNIFAMVLICLCKSHPTKKNYFQTEKQAQKGVLLHHSKGQSTPRHHDQHIISYHQNLRGKKQKYEEREQIATALRELNLLRSQRNGKQLDGLPEKYEEEEEREFRRLNGERESRQSYGERESRQPNGERESRQSYGQRESRQPNVLNKRTDNEYLIDHPEDVDPDDPLELVLEGEAIEGQGYMHEVEGLHPQDSKKTWGNSHDTHYFLGQEELESGQADGTDKRNFLQNTNINRLWHKGVVPYVFYNVSSATQDVVNKAIKQFNEQTCIRWVPKDKAADYNLDHSNVIYFVNAPRCSSYVGNLGWYFGTGIQRITMEEPGCTSVSTAVHEMYHAIGGMHEQSRDDRDAYVDVLWENVQGGTGNGNMRSSQTQNNNPYDAESVMQYSLFAFSINGHRTMEFKDRRLDFLADAADGIEFYDAQDITDAYKCADHCVNPPACENGGFVNFQCKCVCPDGLSGDLCTDTVSNSVLCGGVITLESNSSKFIQSPNSLNGLECTWLIKTTPGNLVRATVEYMDLPAGKSCYHWLEYRYNMLGQVGPKRCGTRFDAGKEVWDSTEDEISNAMMIKFNSTMKSVTTNNKGFLIKLQSIGKGCVKNSEGKYPCVFGSCYSPPGTSAYTCTCDTGVSGTNCEVLSDSAVVTCEFEYTDKCFLEQDKNDRFDWYYENDKTYVGSFNIATGPSRPKSGYQYIYMQAYRKVQGDKAVLVNADVQFTSTPRCMSFYYHMYGTQIGALNVYIEGSGANEQKSLVFSKTGNQGNMWKKAEVNIPAMSNLKIYFEGVVGTGYIGDIGLDDIKLAPGACVKTVQHVTKHCGFEDTSNSCIFSESYADDFDWTRKSGSTPSYSTGPTGAFNGMYYKYIEVSSPVQSGDKAVLTTKDSKLTSSPYCLSFHYHMYGLPGSLVVSAGERNAVDSTTVWTKSGDQGNNWNKAFIEIDQLSDPVIEITASKGSSFQGDIAIDDLDLKEGECVMDMACDFEDSNENCVFVDSDTDDFDWRRKSGSTPSSNTGPNSAFSGQFYKYIEVSTPIQNGQNAILTTKTRDLESSPYCLAFEYHMYGWSVGTLSVNAGNNNSNTGLSKLWSLSGDQGNSWKSIKINIQKFTDPVIEIEGIKGSNWSGDIAIDNLVLTKGECDSGGTEA